MNKTLIDNSEHLKMVDKLNECIADPNINTIRIATGYWDIPGFALVAEELQEFLKRKDAKMRIIIGKDPYVFSNIQKNPKMKDPHYPQDFIRTDINDIKDNLIDEYQKAFLLLLDNCKGDDPKIDIHIYKNEDDENQFFHSKCYIFSHRGPSPVNPDKIVDRGGEFNMYAILGSSNFTKKGLEGNSELNILEDDYRIIDFNNPDEISTKGHIQWFEEKWSQSIDWTKEFLEQVLKPSKPVKKLKEREEKKEPPFTPYELYIKLLQMKFGDVIDKNLGEQIKSYLPPSIESYDFQIEAVKRCMRIMSDHGGFMLADVVGLGKTIIGSLIIKRFLTSDVSGRAQKVLIITPPAIQSGWKKTIALFDEYTDKKMSPFIDFITTGRIVYFDDDADYSDFDDDCDDDRNDFYGSFGSDNYGLIIIDESHKFRNSNTLMYKSLDELISNIVVKTGLCPYVGLLSATPQNNRPDDIKNQIYLFERNHNASTLKKADGGNLESFFSRINREYNVLMKKDSKIPVDIRQTKIGEISKQIRDCILTDILERRTRTDIKEYYPQDLKGNRLVFPEIDGPHDLKYIMDDELAQLFADTMTIIAPDDADKAAGKESLGYYRYRAIEYFKSKKNQNKYKGRGNRGVENISDQLATIMQTMLVKRLESSFNAFRESLKNLRQYTENMIDMWEKDAIFVCPQIEVNKELDYRAKTKKHAKTDHKKVTLEDCFEDIRRKIKELDKQGRNSKKQNAEYHRTDFNENYITLLHNDKDLITDLYDRWCANSEDPKLDKFKECLTPELFNPEKNTSHKLVIFSEAVDTVNALKQTVTARGYRPLVVKASNRDKKEKTIEENFDANYQGEQKDDYDVIITTEVLAEGINLHRANVILNYDTPWNSTKLMQRIGRVNRIGSKFSRVYVYNFMPSAQGNAEIKLKEKAFNKLQAFHVLFGEDNKIYTDEEQVVHYPLKEMVDGEASPLEKYVYELKQYRDDHPERYNLIDQTDKGWEIASSKNGTAFFVVDTPKASPLAIQLSPGASYPVYLSSTDIIEKLQCAEDTARVPLPDNWDTIKKQAILDYHQYFVADNSNSRGGTNATKAKKIISKLFSIDTLTRHTRDLLNKALILVGRGSVDMINCIIAIGDKLKDNDLFKLSHEQIDDIISRELGKMAEKVAQNQGEAIIKLGTIK